MQRNRTGTHAGRTPSVRAGDLGSRSARKRVRRTGESGRIRYRAPVRRADQAGVRREPDPGGGGGWRRTSRAGGAQAAAGAGICAREGCRGGTSWRRGGATRLSGTRSAGPRVRGAVRGSDSLSFPPGGNGPFGTRDSAAGEPGWDPAKRRGTSAILRRDRNFGRCAKTGEPAARRQPSHPPPRRGSGRPPAHRRMPGPARTGATVRTTG